MAFFLPDLFGAENFLVGPGRFLMAVFFAGFLGAFFRPTAADLFGTRLGGTRFFLAERFFWGAVRPDIDFARGRFVGWLAWRRISLTFRRSAGVKSSCSVDTPARSTTRTNSVAVVISALRMALVR